MESEKERLIRLFDAKSLTEDEKIWLLNYLEKDNLSDLRLISLEQYLNDLLRGDVLSSNIARKQLDKIHDKIDFQEHRQYSKMWIRRISAAAILLIALSSGIYFFGQENKSLGVAKKESSNDIQPGGDKAMLTLGNGTVVVLSNVNKGVLVNEGNIAISKNKEGQVVYHVTKIAETKPGLKVEYNTISTPKSGQYEVVLSDGTKVWLNSVSSIRFPTVFAGNQRKVEITGEVYFEVAKDKSKPFRVISAKQTVEVLGTHFNINAYSDEQAVKTTLIEGSVKIFKGVESALLKPGQQAETKKSIDIIDLPNAEAEVSWKSGTFYFKDSGIETVMRQAARWYDLEVKYEGKIPVKQFNGKVPRNVTISKFLEMLDYAGINFKIDGRRITITQ